MSKKVPINVISPLNSVSPSIRGLDLNLYLQLMYPEEEDLGLLPEY